MLRYLLFSISLIVCSCGTKNLDKEARNIEVNLENLTPFKSSQLFSSVEITPLETTKESLLTRIDKLIPYKELYYLLDQDQGQITIFNKAGKYVKKIAREGQGPGEYGKLSDMVLDQMTEQLELLSPDGKVNVYSLDGEWIEDYTIPDLRSVHLMEIINQDLRTVYSKDSRLEHNLAYYSKSKNELVFKTHTNTSIFEENAITLSRSPFKKADNSILFCTPFTNEIYILAPEGMKLLSTWNFGKYNPNFKQLNGIDEPAHEVFIEKFLEEIGSSFVSFSNYVENKDLIFFQLPFKKGPGTFVIAKEKMNIIPLQLFPYEAVHLLDNEILAVSDPDFLRLYLRDDPFISAQIGSIAYINKDDNPVILRFKLEDISKLQPNLPVIQK